MRGFDESLWRETCHVRWTSEGCEPGLALVIVPACNRADFLADRGDGLQEQARYRSVFDAYLQL